MAGRARRRWLVAGVVLAALVAATGALLFVFRDRANPVEREDVDSTLVTGGGEPGDFGLYLYATDGFESTDALVGSRHDYPAQTYITIQPGGCGTLVRWQALEERWDEWDFCADGSLAGWQGYHEWFGSGTSRTGPARRPFPPRVIPAGPGPAPALVPPGARSMPPRITCATR